MDNRKVAKGHQDEAILMGLGVAAGLLGGIAIARRRPRPLPQFDAWQRALVETHGELKGTLLAARVGARYETLYAARPRFAQPALRTHLETNILPGLALYQVSREEEGSEEAALAGVDRLFEAWSRLSSEHKMLKLAEGLPNPFSLLRIGNRLVMKQFPPQGWTIEWLEDSSRCVAYNIYGCFYLNVLTHYGAPELTAHFCRLDDLLFGDVRGISWERTKTLGRGDDCCDFRFRPATVAQGEQETNSR